MTTPAELMSIYTNQGQVNSYYTDKIKILHVKSFLCDDGQYVQGDGVHDDTTGIQRAIDYAYTTLNYSLYFPSGTYKITYPIFLHEYCKLYGENKLSTYIYKTTNTKASNTGYVYDAVVIFANYSKNSAITQFQRVENISIKGNITAYVAGKDITTKQTGILCLDNSPYINILDVDTYQLDDGFHLTGCWVSNIKRGKVRGYYTSVWIESECQGLTLENVNALSFREYGFLINGSSYNALISCLAEWGYGGCGFNLRFGRYNLSGCGVELCKGLDYAFKFENCGVELTSSFMNRSSTDAYYAIYLNGAYARLSNATIAKTSTRSDFVADTKGGFYYLSSDSELIIEDNNNFLNVFEQQSVILNDSSKVKLSNGVAIRGKQTYLGASTKIESNYLDSTYNPTTTIYSKKITLDNKSTPLLTNGDVDLSYQMGYKRGDIALINNPSKSNQAIYVCTNDVYSSHECTGVITAVDTVAKTITVDTLDLSHTATTGETIANYAKNWSINSSSDGTNVITSVNSSTNVITLYSAVTNFVVGDTLTLTVTSPYLRSNDFSAVQIASAGTTAKRPSTNLKPGQYRYNIELGRPEWFVTGTTWADKIGNFVAVPATPAAAGNFGDFSADVNYAYFCYGANTWIRIAKDATWT